MPSFHSQYLWTAISQDEGCIAEAANRIEKAWDSPSQLFCVTRLKMLILCAFSQAMVYSHDIWPHTALGGRLSFTEIKMLRYFHGISLEDHITKEKSCNLARVEEGKVSMV